MSKKNVNYPSLVVSTKFDELVQVKCGDAIVVLTSGPDGLVVSLHNSNWRQVGMLSRPHKEEEE